MVMGGSVQEDFGHVSKLIQKAQKERRKAFGPTYGQIKNFLNPTIPETSLRSISSVSFYLKVINRNLVFKFPFLPCRRQVHGNDFYRKPGASPRNSLE